MVKASTKEKAGSAGVLVALSLAMFVYVIDTTIMGVSQSDLVTDLDTTITGVQLALTIYTLTMAAFMTTGAKLGKIWGAKKAFKIGLVVYGIGTVTTALAPNLVVLLIGWSVLEGLGSALIVPAINTLVRANYDGTKRASAYGTLGGVAAAGAAIGPIVGGWITTTFTWRVAFWIEAIIVVGVLLASNKIADAEPEAVKPRLDLPGVFLSAAGLGLFVYGILQSGTLGWGSPVVWGLVAAGSAVIIWFVQRSRKQEREGGDPLLRFSIFRWPVISAGVPVTIAQNFAQNGILYVVPVFAQLVLGLDALKTGLAVLPLSIGVMVMSMGTAKLGHKIYPRLIIQVGMLVVFAGGVLLAMAIPDADSGSDLIVSMFVLGAGIGIIAAQLQNVMLGGVDPDETSEAAGLAGTAQNLGMSLGTAVAGSVLIVTLGAAFSSGVDDSTVLVEGDKEGIEQILDDNAETMGTEFEALLADRPQDVVAETERIAEDAADAAFQVAVLALGVIALLGFLFAFKLPKVKLEGEVVDEAVRGTAVIPKFQLEPTLARDYESAIDDQPDRPGPPGDQGGQA